MVGVLLIGVCAHTFGPGGVNMRKYMAKAALVLCTLVSVFVSCGEDLEEENEALKARVNELETDVYELSEVLRLTRETNAELSADVAELQEKIEKLDSYFYANVDELSNTVSQPARSPIVG